MTKILKDIELLCALSGTSGFEEDVAKTVSEELESYGISVRIDNLGNVIGRKGGGDSGISVALAAHLDEVGLVIGYVEESGFLRFDTNGLVDPRVLPGAAICIRTNSGACYGVVGTKPSHLTTVADRKHFPEISELWIDVGANSRDEIAQRGIRVGDPATYQANFHTTSNGYLFSKALDNRIGVAILLELARRSQAVDFPFDLYLVGTVQEEIGSRGAKTAAESLKPTIAVVIDSVSAIDPTAQPPRATAHLGRGPVLRTLDYRDYNQGTVYSRKLRDFIIRVAEKDSLPYQLDIFRTWTDASTMSLAYEGIATQGLFVPRRYSHAPVEVACLNDVQVTADLVWQFLRALDVERLRNLQKRF